MHGGHHREAAICVLHMISHAMLFTVSGSAQDTADKTKVAKNVWKVHNVGFGAQQSLGTHLFWRSLA